MFCKLSVEITRSKSGILTSFGIVAKLLSKDNSNCDQYFFGGRSFYSGECVAIIKIDTLSLVEKKVNKKLFTMELSQILTYYWTGKSHYFMN